MAIAHVSATDLAATAEDRRAAALVVTALALAPAALVVMALADLAATNVVTMTAALPALKTHRSFVQSSRAPSSLMT